MLFPAFLRLENVTCDAPTLNNLAAAYLAAKSLHPFHVSASLSPIQQARLVRDESIAERLPRPTAITHPVVLICGHGGRDERCGILGPILEDAFKKTLGDKGIEAEVGTISHIGGHKFAGNVIIYLPPGASGDGHGNRQRGALNGTGLWYGRVGPENVEGIVEETVLGGRVIADLFRGGITQDAGDLGRALEAQMKVDNGEDGEDALDLKPGPRK